MTTGLKASVANALLDALCNAADYTAPVAFFVKLHTGDPGAAGTANAAGNTTRVAAAFGAASGGAAVTTGDIDWISVSTTETYTHVSYWDAASSGNFIASAVMTAPRSVVAADNFTIPTGSLTLTLAPLAA